MFRKRSVLLPALLVAAFTAWYLAWEIVHRGVFAYSQSIYPVDDADEWRYVACSRLVLHGYEMFDQVFSAQPPLLFASLATGMRVFGDDIAGARAVEITFGLLALGATVWLAGRLGGRWAAVIGVALLAISPGFLIYYHTVEAEGPMMALTALSLAFCAESSRSQRGSKRAGPIWAVFGGLALAAAVLTKLFALEAVLPALWLLESGARHTISTDPGPRMTSIRWLADSDARRLFGFLSALIVPVGLDFGPIAPAAQWQQVVEMHDRAASAQLPDLTPAREILWHFLTLDAGLSVLAGAGLVCLLLARRWRELGFASLWLLGTGLMLLAFRPLFPHHAAILLAPLAVTAGLGVSGGIRTLGERRRAAVLVVWAAAVVYLGLLFRVVRDDRHALYAAGSSPSDALASYLAARTTPGDLVAVDDTRAADTAPRLVAPPLCDPSTVRLKAGYLTAADLISATQSYHVRLVAPTTGLFLQVPAYTKWLRKHYHAVRGPQGQIVYFRSASQAPK